MLFVLGMILLYFLPAIIAHNKRDFTAIFLVDLLFGWTVIGWIVALIWACSAETRPQHVMVVAGPAAIARYCCRCGTIAAPAARYCAVCGTPMQ
ncbi:MAG TPA: superinfection immunity protein [Candidatus Acidoferrum sp.]|nr:superinfection immunity protein [Candidatus Acidoferrum sp.]